MSDYTRVLFSYAIRLIQKIVDGLIYSHANVLGTVFNKVGNVLHSAAPSKINNFRSKINY